MRQDLDVVAAGWCLRWIGASRGDDIDGGVVRQFLVAKDAAEVLVQIGRVEEVVMCELRIDPIQSKVQNDPGAGWFEAAQLLHHGSGRMQQPLHGGNDFHVGDDVIGRHRYEDRHWSLRTCTPVAVLPE